MERGRFNIKFQKRIIKFRVSMREKYQLQVFIKDLKEKYGLHTTTFGFEPIARTIHSGFNSNRHVGSTGQWGIRSEIFNGRQIRLWSRKHFLKMTLLPSTKRHIATPSLKCICHNLPPRTISIALWISPRLHLTLLPIPLHQRPPQWSFHYLRTRSATPSSTTSAPELLPRRPLPPHQSCFPIVHYLHTGAAPPSATSSAPDLLHRRPVLVHWIYFPVGRYLRTGATPSVGQYLRRAATWMIDHGRSRYAKSIHFVEPFPSSSSSMGTIVRLYLPLCQQPVTS
jgi:hypothetical protein